MVPALIAGLALVSAGLEPATVSLDLWFSPVQYAGCSGDFYDWQLADQTCDDVNPRGLGGPTFAWVILSGAGEGDAGIGGVQFGVEYPETVQMVSWALCTGASEIPEPDWPDSGSGNAMTFRDGCLPGLGEAGFRQVGFFHQTPESRGLIRLIADPRVGEALAAGCDTKLSAMCEAQLGTGECDPDAEPGRVACGQDCAVPVRDESWSRIKSRY